MQPPSTPRAVPASIDATVDLLAGADYLADRALGTVLFLALKMSRPLFLEGEAGVGKGHSQAVLRTPRDAAPMRTAVGGDAQHELVGNGRNFHPDDLGTTIGKIAYDAFAGKTAIANVHLGRRIPFDPEGLSAVAHIAVSAWRSIACIEMGKCEKRLNQK